MQVAVRAPPALPFFGLPFLAVPVYFRLFWIHFAVIQYARVCQVLSSGQKPALCAFLGVRQRGAGHHGRDRDDAVLRLDEEHCGSEP